MPANTPELDPMVTATIEFLVNNLLWIPAVFFGLCFLISFLIEPRQFRNALFFLGLVVTFLFALLVYTGQDLILIGGTMFMLLVFPFLAILFLLINTVIVVRRNGFSFASLLPACLAVFIGFMMFSILHMDTPSMPMWAIVFMAGFAMEGLWFSFSYVALLLYSWFYRLLPRRRVYDYIIVHGAGLMGTELTPLLAGRVDKALEVWRHQGQQGKLIVSGGQGADEVISEAEAMKRYLVDRHGVAEDAIIKEDRSTTTMENLSFSKAIMDKLSGEKNYRAAVVTSDYHVFRCAEYAHKLKINADGVGSHTRGWYWPAAFTREFIAITKAHLWPYIVIAVLWLLLMISATKGILW